MMDFANSTSGSSKQQLLLSAQFLHKEIPVRLAHRVAELENLPHGISSKPQVQTVRDWYVESFRELRDFKPVKNTTDEEEFTDLIKSIMKRHTNVVPMMAKGILELRRDLGSERALNDLPEIHKFLDGFYMSRIGIRMLLGQHVALHEPPRDGWIGLICTNLSPVGVAEEAVADARDVCLRRYGEAPEVEVFGDPNFTFAYVPGHLHQMLFELLKNSLRAVTERFSESSKAAPPIRVVIAEGDEDITIKVSDEGGGIPRSGLPNIWTVRSPSASYTWHKLRKCGFLFLFSFLFFWHPMCMRILLVRGCTIAHFSFMCFNACICSTCTPRRNRRWKISMQRMKKGQQLWLDMGMAYHWHGCMRGTLGGIYSSSAWRSMARMHSCTYHA